MPAADLERHVHEVPDVAEIVPREDVRQSARVAEDEGGDRRQLREEPNALQVAALGVADPLRVRVEGREGADGAEEHAHRVRVVAEALEELLHVRVDVRVEPDVLLELGELRAVGSSPSSSR